ncbi:MAG: TonB-dependent siderophore receptor [Zoogloea sp.]|uniref:TonB-dependent receptor n=1 Tax=Zoogloea sp. TaxID=49181 RepID=UPI0026108BE8|nr:TonB-dependent siderophore receptor [Zoogloea sp.]MDD3328956.1 TonB-dependent siderophore receptor [Zoogloea sp.]
MAHKKSRHRHIPKQANPAATGERAILPLGALMFAASMSSWAQTADDDTKTLKPVVVKATAEAEPSGKDSLRTTTTRIGKGKQQLRDIPQSVTVVTEKLIDDRKIDTVKEALKMTSGVTFLAAEGGEEDIRLRGFPLNTTGDLFIDGMRDPAFYDRDTFNMDRIEVLRGSASMLFGRGSTGGAVNQVNKQAKLLDETRVDLTLGSYQYRRVVADVNVKTGDDSALRINAMRTLADNNGAGSSLDKYGFAADYRWGIGSRDEFEVNFFYLQNDNGINYGLPYIRKSATNAALTTIPVDPSSYYGAQSDYNHGSAGYATFAHTHRFSADTELVTKIRKGDFNRDQRASTVRIAGAALQPGGVLATRENFSSATVLNRGSQNKIQSMENLFAQSDLSTKFEALGLKHEVLTGVDFAWEKKIVRGARSAAQGGVTIPAKPTTTIGAGGTGWVDEDARVIGKTSEFESLSGGVYAQDLIQVAPHWKLLAGLRYDGMSAQYDTFNLGTNAVTNYQQSIYKMSNRFGVLFQPSDRHSFHLSYGTSFNTSGDTYSYSNATVNTPPEKSMNVELGAKIDSADRRMSSRFALFRGVKLNERNTDPLLNIAVLSGKRHATGFETDVIGRITPRWEIFGSYTWIWDAEIDKGAQGAEGEGRRPSLIPKHQAALWSTYQVDEKMRVGIGANARTKMTPNRNPVNLYSDGYVTYDAMAEYEAIQDKLTLKANLINLTNKFYADSMYANGHYVPGVGRTVYITGSLKF